MVLLDPITALLVSFTLLGIMLYKRVSIGVTLVASSIAMSLLSMNLSDVATVFIETSLDPTTISLVLVTIGIMLLSQLYKETHTLDILSRSFGGLFRNPKFVVSALPALLGLLPVPGGALMSAPLVEKEAEKLGLEGAKKTYLNVWFRHIIFPIYPMSQLLILTAALTGISITPIILGQIPVVVTMTAVGYLTVLRTASPRNGMIPNAKFQKNLSDFVYSFLPILAMILTVAFFRIDVVIAAGVGILMLTLITKPPSRTLVRAFLNPAPYKIALAAFGAMLLRSVTMASGASGILGQAIASWNVNEVVLLATIPATLAFLIGSPSGGIALSVPIIASVAKFSAAGASLLYISAFLGYLVTPIHLCLALTADYFRCSLNRVYRLLVPSFGISFAVALLTYLVM
jgi:integral membrane protein (TIGR00529 family)